VGRRLAISLLAVGVLSALPVSAGAVLSGENGRIAFVSGRDADADALAQIHLLPVPSSTGGGTVSPAITSFGAQHRHPTWSPDRTKIAYARGVPPELDIFVQDLTNPGSTPVNITNSPGITDDRPAWSPDGTRIAYESEVTDGSNQLDIIVDDAPFGTGTLNLTNSASVIDGKPAWNPDSQTLYYAVGDVNVPPNGGANDVQIFQEPSNNGGVAAPLVHITNAHTFQPSISPDGTKICYTASTTAGLNANANIIVAPLSTASSGIVLANSGVGDYNCTWSPDGTLVAYVTGTFSTGKLVMEPADNSLVVPIDLAQDPGADNFDGNPDWAPDARPVCPDSTVNTTPNTPITFQVTCNDTGPAYEQTDVREFSTTSPVNGTLTQEFAGDPFTYTPNQGFVGTDAFQVRSFDGLGFGSDTGTVTINVQNPPPPPPPPKAKCAGETATIVGTTGADVLRGTGRRDVIASLGGNDRIRGGRGNDLICAGSGRDRVAAGSGGDRVLGGSGPDRLSGNSGNDRLSGGTGRDTLIGGSGRDRLSGGPSRDLCRGGLGRDAGSRCERRSSIP
jgi:hypothetical protein